MLEEVFRKVFEKLVFVGEDTNGSCIIRVDESRQIMLKKKRRLLTLKFT